MSTSVPPRAARPRDAGSTRTDLLHAARRRFTLHGYERSTSREIAADAGVNVSLINRYFGSKEGLFEAVVEQTAGTLAELPAASVAELVDQTLLGMATDAWPEYGHEHPLLLLLHGIGADERTAELRRRVLRSVLASITELIGTQDAETRAGVLLALFAGVLMLREAVPDSALGSVDPDELRHVLTRAARAITR